MRDGGVVVFDFDGVLTSRDTMVFVCRLRLLSDPRRLVAAVPSLLRRSFSRDAGVRQRSDRALVAVALRGLDRAGYEDLTRIVVSRFVDAGWLRHDLVAELRSAASRGRTVVATASESMLVRAFLDVLDVRGVAVLGSELELTARGLRFAVHNVGEQKLATLRAARVPLAAATFYTDSVTDLPVAAASSETVYVGADGEALRRLPRSTLWYPAGSSSDR
ncbi:HAD family hydrolase [Curtobacterium sp. MCLR17_036]|uniref:HAD family hydrolase n=1 Tax=Curtobacterium sp. MCLR17_036 TaxID=2175620 RepID=UPI000DA80241|nr:HAD family hydrolase [Curtobacterium sp. MCLR17_036]WIE66436.1 HAD family hydrolase [Curtobacterium sp. MCLR17_036]